MASMGASGPTRRSPPAARRDEPARTPIDDPGGATDAMAPPAVRCGAVCQVDAANPRNMPDPNQSTAARQGSDDDRTTTASPCPEGAKA